MAECVLLLLISYIISFVIGEIIDCQYITKNEYWELSTGTFLFNQNHCEAYGADYVSIHSSQDIQNIADLCKSCARDDVYIGVELETCSNDHNFTLKWTDDTVMNYSYINWCQGYPQNLCNISFIYFDGANTCFKNDYDQERSAICGNPYQCLVYLYVFADL